MSTLPPCPQCGSEYTYEDGVQLVCPECGGELSEAGRQARHLGLEPGAALGVERFLLSERLEQVAGVRLVASAVRAALRLMRAMRNQMSAPMRGLVRAPL